MMMTTTNVDVINIDRTVNAIQNGVVAPSVDVNTPRTVAALHVSDTTT